MAEKRWPFKDPDETLWYTFNWTPRRLGQGLITDVQATVENGDVTITDSEVAQVPGSRVGQGTRHRITGGTVGDNEINLHIEVDGGAGAGGTEFDQTIFLEVANR